MYVFCAKKNEEENLNHIFLKCEELEKFRFGFKEYFLKYNLQNPVQQVQVLLGGEVDTSDPVFLEEGLILSITFLQNAIPFRANILKGLSIGRSTSM
jgi:hypothetical protein